MATLTYTDANNLSPQAQAYIQKRRNRGQRPFVGSMDSLNQHAATYAERQGVKNAVTQQRERSAQFKTMYGGAGGSAYDRKKQSLIDIMNDPALQAYNSSYGANFDAARSAVNNAFANAMGEINTRSGAANTALDQMPGVINQAYGDAAASMTQQENGMYSAQQASGLNPFMDAHAITAPVSMANSTDQAGRIAGIPLIRTGIEGALSKERQAATSDRDQSLADIAEREAAAHADDNKPNFMQEMFLNEAMNEDQAGPNDKWGTGYIGTDRGGDTINSRPRFTAALRSQAAGPRAQMAYNDALDQFSKLRRQGKALDSHAFHKITERLRKSHGKYMGAINLALVDAGYS